MNIAIACNFGFLGHHCLELYEVDFSILVLIDFLNKVFPVFLIELIICHLKSVLEIVESDGATTIHVEEFESPVELFIRKYPPVRNRDCVPLCNINVAITIGIGPFNDFFHIFFIY